MKKKKNVCIGIYCIIKSEYYNQVFRGKGLKNKRDQLKRKVISEAEQVIPMDECKGCVLRTK